MTGRNFYELIKSGNSSEINRVSDLLVSRMALYLKSVMQAEHELAEDCAQQAFEKVYGKILENSLDDIDDIFGYLIRSAKNEYLMSMRREKFEVSSEHAKIAPIQDQQMSDSLEIFYDRERHKQLEKCVSKMKLKKRKFFRQVLEHINEKDKDAAEKIGMSYANFRTKKSRIIEALRECVKNSKVIN